MLPLQSCSSAAVMLVENLGLLDNYLMYNRIQYSCKEMSVVANKDPRILNQQQQNYKKEINETKNQLKLAKVQISRKYEV
jgi:hypothetical protein